MSDHPPADRYEQLANEELSIAAQVKARDAKQLHLDQAAVYAMLAEEARRQAPS